MVEQGSEGMRIIWRAPELIFDFWNSIGKLNPQEGAKAIVSLIGKAANDAKPRDKKYQKEPLRSG